MYLATQPLHSLDILSLVALGVSVGTLVLSLIAFRSARSITRDSSRRAGFRHLTQASDDSSRSVNVTGQSTGGKLSRGMTLLELTEIALARALGHWNPRD